ncbi:ATP-binding cassette domain-containing protein, partial [Candidatus Bipolaricaulota bacterium]|nr:ATP-binding cassette domain-containing protein [Candidatus Bipolaricaulota bacterium]
MLAIKTNLVSKSYGATQALSKVSLTVRTGDIYGFLGPNGAGKTTMIRVMLGLLKADQGEIELLERDIDDGLKYILPEVGTVLAPPSFYPHLSGGTNLRLFSDLSKTDGSVSEVLKQVNLSSAASKKFSDYSTGMKQRLAIAAALLKNPELLILDEPTSGLDPQGRVEIREIIGELGEAGKTIFLSTHLLNEVQQVCNRVGVLKEGKLIAEDEVTHLLGGEEEVLIQVPESQKETAVEALRSSRFVSSVSAGERYLRISSSEGNNYD